MLHAGPYQKRHRERTARRKQNKQRAGNKPTKRGKGVPTHLVLQCNAEDHREDTREQDREQSIEPPRSEEGVSNKDDQNKHREVAQHVDQSTQAFPNQRKIWATTQVAVIFADEGFIASKWKKQETDGVHPPFAPLEEVMEAQDGYQKRRVKIQDPIRLIMLLCGQDAPQGRVPRGNMARELSKAIPVMARQRQWYEGSVPVVPDENSQLSIQMSEKTE